LDSNNGANGITKDEYDELLRKLKNSETESSKLRRELRTANKNIDIMKLNMESQTVLNELITGERQRQEMYVRLLLESCPDPMFIFDENMKFLLGTKSTTNIIGIDDVSILQGRELNSIVTRYHPPVFTERLTTLITDLISSSGMRGIEKSFEISADNKKFEVNVLPFYKDDGAFAGALILMHDITEIVRTKEIAEQASMAKGEFLSRMSHEMRTPMNAIIGMTNIAKRSDDPEKKEYCLDKIGNASNHLLGVINDILDMSKIEANKFELSFDVFSFERMLINVMNVINFRVEEKQQSLVIDLDDSIPESIVGDEFRLTQVITNLLTNAIKFTPEYGTITLSTKNIPVTDGKPVIQIEVADTGIGISAEQQSRLFVSFEQADGGTARKYGGTGLGLAISKRIVELMGGSIWIESMLGCGSKFIFTIQYEQGEIKQQPRLSINKEDVRVLVVDDSPETREYFADVMKSHDLPCDVAADGFEALAMLGDRNDKSYNIFFIDWQMPNMNGIELTRRIKEIIENNAVIIMISVSEGSEIEKEALQAGVNRFITKPLFPSILIDCINECVEILHNDDGNEQTSDIQVVHDYHGHNIMIAEDIEINREIMAAVLEETGLSIDFAENGQEAVSLYKKQPGRYSLIFMDIQMPEMDGYEATRQIRSLADEYAGTIPIVAMTANVFREDIESCLAAGMNDHLGKPIDMDDLFEKLELYLG